MYHSRFSFSTQIWHFCTILTSRGFEKFQQKIKLPSVGIELTTPTITGLEFYAYSNALPTQPICHSLPVSDFQTFIKSCSIESRNDPSPKSEVEHETKFTLRIFYSTHVWVAEWHLPYNPVIADVVSSITTEGNFVFYWSFLKPLM